MRAARRLACLLAAAICFDPPTARAQGNPITCGQSYTVVYGDTLRNLALRANGNDNFQAIYQRNRNVLRGPDQLEVGDRLFIPCAAGNTGRGGSGVARKGQPQVVRPRDSSAGGATRGRLAATPRKAAARSTTPSAVHSPAAADKIKAPQRPIMIVTADGAAPFTGRHLPDGGLFADLVRHALARADQNRPYRISYVNDRAAHRQVLLPEGMFDLSFPWARPDCSPDAKKPALTANLCRDFDFSDPFVEVTAGVFTLAGNGAVGARTLADIGGMSLCVSAGDALAEQAQVWAESHGLRIVPMPNAESCFDLLLRGKVDLVRQNSALAARSLARLDQGRRVVEIEALAETHTLHVMASKSDPAARMRLDVLNRGLKDLRESGLWFDLVSGHMSHHAATGR